MPVVALRGIVLFPGTTLHFDVGRRSSVSAVKSAVTSSTQEILVVMQQDIMVDNPDFDDLCEIGVVAQIKQIIKIPEANEIRVVVEGKYRAKITETIIKRPFMKAFVEPMADILPAVEERYEKAMMREAYNLMLQYSRFTAKMAPDLIINAEKAGDPGKLCDLVAGNIMLSYEVKQELLEELDPYVRLNTLAIVLLEEINIMTLEDEIHKKVQSSIDKNQRDYFLREQQKIIAEELGENEQSEDEIDEFYYQIHRSKMPDENKEKLYTELSRYRRLNAGNPEAGVIRTYIERCLALPWGKYSKENTKLDYARKVLDKDHYGLKEVKERIIEMLAARILNPNIKGNIICLVGPPGVGKTSVAKSIARAMNRKYIRISLGGVRDEAEIRGHRRTYIGAIPGRIMNALTDAKTANPLILLDEVDKLSGDFRGDPASALLEVLDSEQNFSFTDHYTELPFDLSRVLFITTANDASAIPRPLLDRMEIIEHYSYTHEEKFNIAKKHLIVKQLKEHSLTKKQLKISDEALREIIDGYTRESGVRKLERQIAKLCRKTAVKVAEGNNDLTEINPSNLECYLGVKKYRDDDFDALSDEIGVVNGLAWTSVGGELLKVEVSVLEGSGKIELTGSLGEVMKESARTAVSFVRSRAELFKIDKDFYKNKDIHIHFPEGAVPKDGPSAGITVTTALVSALASLPVSGKIAMTGEVTLRGRVFPIGGLREKSMAAYRAGISTVIIPQGNEPDISELDSAVLEKVSFIPVRHVDEVLELALIKPIDEIEKANPLIIADGVCTDWNNVSSGNKLN